MLLSIKNIYYPVGLCSNFVVVLAFSKYELRSNKKYWIKEQQRI